MCLALNADKTVGEDGLWVVMIERYHEMALAHGWKCC